MNQHRQLIQACLDILNSIIKDIDSEDMLKIQKSIADSRVSEVLEVLKGFPNTKTTYSVSSAETGGRPCC